MCRRAQQLCQEECQKGQGSLSLLSSLADIFLRVSLAQFLKYAVFGL